MRIQTMSVVVGGNRCNAKCPFCVSRMTGLEDVRSDSDSGMIPHYRNFHSACRLAKDSGVSTVLLTGKGEPTLYPHTIATYIDELAKYKFPMVELQTNGIAIGIKKTALGQTLKNWAAQGLTTVCLSAVSEDRPKNRKIYGPAYPEIDEVVKVVKGAGLSMRLTVMLIQGFIDSSDSLARLISYCRNSGIEQLTIRPLAEPEKSQDKDAADWVHMHPLAPYQMEDIRKLVLSCGTKLMDLAHGAEVYDCGGQNVCLSNCLTLNPAGGDNDLRQIIYCQDGHIRYDWRYRGAILL